MSPAKDRLKELNQSVNDTEFQIVDEEPPPEFKEVFQKVYDVRNLIGTIRENTKRINHSVHSNSLSSKDVYNQVESAVKNTYDTAFKINEALKGLDVKPPKNDTDNSDKSVLNRVKRIQYGTLRQEFQNAVFENNNCVESYREYKKSLLRKQAALVHVTMADDELDQLLENPEGFNFFTDNILLDSRIAQEQLNQIEERHSELLKIENMIREINDQFKRIAILVEQQKDYVDRIEYLACDTINYVDKGLENIQTAEKNRKKAKKKLLIFTVCGVTVVIIILVILLL